MKIQNRKKLCLFITVLIMFVVGCGGGETAVSEPQPSPTNATEVINTSESPSPTDTFTPVPIQPTATSAPTSTPTPLPPTPTPVSLVAAYTYVEVNAFQGPDNGIASIAISPDGNIIAYGNYTDNFVHLINASTGEDIDIFEGHTNTVSSLAFNPQGTLLASTGSTSSDPDDGTVRIWDIDTGNQLALFETQGIRQLTFSPEGNVLAGAGGGNPVQVTLWDIETLSEQIIISGIFVNSSFNPDGNIIASGSRDDFVHLVDVDSGEELMLLSGHEGWVNATAFSSNGKLLATGSDDNTIRLWNTTTGESIKSLAGHESAVEFLAFSPDGKILTSLGSGINIIREGNQVSIGIGGEQIVRFWDIETGEQIGSIEFDEGVSNISISSDWTRIVTGSSDGMIRLWESEALEQYVSQFDPIESQAVVQPTSTPAITSPMGNPIPEPKSLNIMSFPTGSEVFVLNIDELDVDLLDQEDHTYTTRRLLGFNRLSDMDGFTVTSEVTKDEYYLGKAPLSTSLEPGNYVVFLSVPETVQITDSAILFNFFEDGSTFGASLVGLFGGLNGRAYLIEIVEDETVNLTEVWQERNTPLEEIENIYPPEETYMVNEQEIVDTLTGNIPEEDIPVILRLLRKGGKAIYREDESHRIIIEIDPTSGSIATILRYED